MVQDLACQTHGRRTVQPVTSNFFILKFYIRVVYGFDFKDYYLFKYEVYFVIWSILSPWSYLQGKFLTQNIYYITS